LTVEEQGVDVAKQLKVSDAVYDDLANLKEEGSHTSFDSLLRELITTHRLAGGICIEEESTFIDPKGDTDPPEGWFTLRELVNSPATEE
jgi:hypothetical protein